MKNALTWFEIPTQDLARAAKFYGEILNKEVAPTEMAGMKMAMLPYQQQEGGVGGALVQVEHNQPSAQGTLVYLDVANDMDNVLARTEKAGGKVAMPKTELSEGIGHIAVIIDCEGNSVGLHSPNMN